MPQEIVSQFDRKYNEPIETYRRVTTITARDNIPSSIRWEGMQVYVTSEQLTYELTGGITNSQWKAVAKESSSQGGLLVSSTTLVELNGVVTDELMRSYVLPANTLSQDGDMVKIMTSGFADMNISPDGQFLMDLWLNGQKVVNVVGYTATDNVYWVEMYLIRTSETELSLKALRLISSGAGPSFDFAFPITTVGFNFDATTDTTIELKGTTAHINDDIENYDFNVELKKVIA